MSDITKLASVIFLLTILISYGTMIKMILMLINQANGSL
jgi:hypothetical protein